MFKADGERRSFSLPRSVTVIGRREDCDVRIQLGEVSRKHCRLIADGDELRIEDLGRSNGTFLNGVRVQEAVVQPGDALQIGPVTFIVQINGIPADDEIQPVQPAAADDTATTQAAIAPDTEPPGPEQFLTEESSDADEIVELDLEEIEEKSPKDQNA
jgi:pSer/pThr/pTyr-binding forkhead associated (FHA) protein